jgi:hypothetical protein
MPLGRRRRDFTYQSLVEKLVKFFQRKWTDGEKWMMGIIAGLIVAGTIAIVDSDRPPNGDLPDVRPDFPEEEISPGGRAKQHDLEKQIEEDLRSLDYAVEQTYDGYVMNYVYSFTQDSALRQSDHFGHQGAPNVIVAPNEALLEAELKRRGDDSIFTILASVVSRN